MQFLKSKAVALMVIVPAASFASYHTTYTVNRPDNSNFEITNLFLMERSPFGGSTTWAFTVDANAPSVTLTNAFPTDNLPTESLLVGLTHDLPGDAPGQQHVVLMMDDTAAQLSKNIAWGTLFRNTDEDKLISDIQLASSGQDWPIIQPGLDGLGAFVDGDASHGILGPGGVEHSSWFTFGGSFTVMSWSNGTVLGSGTSSSYIVPVPEPAPMAAMALGLVGLARRRRAKK